MKRILILTVFASVALVTVLHIWLNLDSSKWFGSAKEKGAEGRFRIGFLPVT